jgi:hypothetical protein
MFFLVFFIYYYLNVCFLSSSFFFFLKEIQLSLIHEKSRICNLYLLYLLDLILFFYFFIFALARFVMLLDFTFIKLCYNYCLICSSLFII